MSNIETYKKIAEIVSEIVNPNNYRKTKLEFNRFSSKNNLIFKISYSKKSNKKTFNDKKISNDEITITELPFIEKLITFLQNKIHELSPKNKCKAEYCECKYKFDEYRLFQLMWELIYSIYYPEEINEWDDLNDDHLLKILRFQLIEETLSPFKNILIREVREIFAQIKTDFPEDTLLDKDGLDKCLNEKVHIMKFLETVWTSKSLINVDDRVVYNMLKPIITLNQKLYESPKYRIDRVRCQICWTDFFQLKIGLIEEKKDNLFDISYAPFNQNKIVNYYPLENTFDYNKWEALQEFYKSHGLTEKQAEVAAKIDLKIPLKKSTLRNTKKQLKNKLGNIEKLYEIWPDLKEINKD